MTEQITYGVTGAVEEIELSSVPAPDDYRWELVQRINLVEMEQAVDELDVEWIEAHREQFAAYQELNDQEKALADMRERVTSEKVTEIAAAIAVMGKSTKDERARKEEGIINGDPRVKTRATMVVDSVKLKANADLELEIVLERRKTLRMRYRGRQEMIRFYSTVERIPYLPAEEIEHIDMDVVFRRAQETGQSVAAVLALMRVERGDPAADVLDSVREAMGVGIDEDEIVL